MARISLEEDHKLAQKNLLRPAVVAKLLGVAPKTIHAWKDIPVKKVHGVKYISWHDICAKCSDSIQTLELPSDGSLAYDVWLTKKAKKVTVLPKQFTVTAAESALAKAKALLKDSFPKVAFIHTADPPKTVEELLAPIKHEEHVLSVPADYDFMLKKTEPVLTTDGCPDCKHSTQKFHTTFGCKFAKGTAAECHCKRGK